MVVGIDTAAHVVFVGNQGDNTVSVLRDSPSFVTTALTQGIAEHGDEIDELIETYAQGWTIHRMPATDRAIVRIGVWEILFNASVPDSVAISEAVEAAKSLSTEDSGGFVNGLFGRIAQTRV